jgi:hypothetical protein
MSATLAAFKHPIICSALLFVGCTTLRAPATIPAFSAGELSEVSQQGVVLQASGSRSQQMREAFDEDLQDIGILALWVSVRNERPAQIELKSKHISLRLGAAARSPLSVAQLFDKYYKRRGIRSYLLSADAKAKEDVSRLSFKPGALGQFESRSGLIFFDVDKLRAADRVGALTLRLRVEGLTLELPLSHADPRS